MSLQDVVLAFTVEGYGTPTFPYGQYRFCTRKPLNDPDNFYIECIEEFPDSLGLSVDFKTNSVTVSGLEFTLQWGPEVLDCFLCEDPASPLQWALPDTPVSISDTDFFVTNDVPKGVWENTLVQWDREVIRLGTSGPGDGEYNNCTRGAYETTVTEHNVLEENLSVVPDRNMFYIQTNRIREDRVIKLYVVDYDDPNPTQNERLIWSGILAEGTTLAPPQVLIYADNMLSLFQEKTICNNLLRFRPLYDPIRFADTDGYSPKTYYGTRDGLPLANTPGFLSGNMLVSMAGRYGARVAWYVDGPSADRAGETHFSIDTNLLGVPADGMPPGNTGTYYNPWPVPAPPYEMSEKVRDAWEFFSTDASIRPPESPQLSSNRFTLCLQILLTGGAGSAPSTYNLGKEDLGCSFDERVIDVEEFERFASLYNDAPLDSLQLAFDGNPVNAYDFIQQEVCGPLSVQVLPGPDGRLRPIKLTDAPDLTNFPTITQDLIQGGIVQIPVDYGADEIPAKFDDQPGLEPLVDRFVNGTRLRRRQRRHVGPSLDLFSTADRELVADIAINWLDRRRVKIRRVMFTALAETDPVLWPGTVFKFTHQALLKARWLPGATFSERFGVVDGLFLCVARTDRWRDGLVDYKVLYVGAIYDRIGAYGPAGRVRAAAGATVQLELPDPVTPFSNTGGFVQGDINATDTAGFAVGDRVQFWDVNFNKKGQATITSLASDTPLDPQFDVDALGGYVRVEGDMVTLAEYTQNPTAAEEFVFIADGSTPPVVAGDTAYEYTS